MHLKPLLAALPLLAGATARPVEVPLQVLDADRALARQAFGGSRKLSLQAVAAGVPGAIKTYRYYPSAEGPPLAQANALRRTLAHLACDSAVFGLVELEGTRSFVGQDDIGIFTKFRFRVVEDWRDRADGAGHTVDLILPGGEVDRGAQRYRIDNPHARYEAGGRYVLLAGSRGRDGASIAGSLAFLAVRSAAIHPAPGWTPFAPGTALAQARREVAAALAQEGCK